jgi:hypothetical protein
MRALGVYRVSVVVLLLIAIAQFGMIVHLMRVQAMRVEKPAPAPAPMVWRAGGSAAEVSAAPVAAPHDDSMLRQSELLAHALRAAEMAWTTSGDGKLALRVSSDASTYSRGHTVKLLIELRNSSGAPIWTAVPNIAAADVKIDSGGGVVPYAGPVVNPAAAQLQWMQPGEVVRSIVELRTDQFTGFDNTAIYRLRCRYACDSSVKSQKAEAWTGAIDSAPVEIRRE